MTGAVAGLATVTPAAGYVPIWSAFVIGIVSGAVCYSACSFRTKRGWDDALDVWGVHGVGGALGSILLGVFAYKSVNAAGADGLIAGNAAFLGKQVAAVAITVVYAFSVTFLILKFLNVFSPVRVPDAVEMKGLDTELHGEEAYVLD